jgi:hypothetical protein
MDPERLRGTAPLRAERQVDRSQPQQATQGWRSRRTERVREHLAEEGGDDAGTKPASHLDAQGVGRVQRVDVGAAQETKQEAAEQ